MKINGNVMSLETTSNAKSQRAIESQIVFFYSPKYRQHQHVFLGVPVTVLEAGGDSLLHALGGCQDPFEEGGGADFSHRDSPSSPPQPCGMGRQAGIPSSC